MTAHDESNATATPAAGGASISGTIEFQNVGEPAFGVTVYVRVQDTGRADAPALTAVEEVLLGVNIVPGAPPAPFTIHGIPQNPDAHYTVRVHADVDGDGRVSRGDYVSTQSYPLPAGGQRAVLAILARPVT